MSDSEIIIAVAKLDGWEWYYIERTQNLFQLKNPNGQCVAADEDPSTTVNTFVHLLPKYTTSRDAIIPVIEKLGMASSDPSDYPRWQFTGYLAEEMGLQFWKNGSFVGGPDFGWEILMATPRQLSIALLKSTDNWRD